jgi:hypothetical protein
MRNIIRMDIQKNVWKVVDSIVWFMIERKGGVL